MTDDGEDFIVEVNHLYKLDHRNILKFYEYYEDRSNYHIVTEICHGGVLFDEIHSRDRFSEKEAATLIRSLLLAVSHCHAHNVVHRDVKPENICF